MVQPTDAGKSLGYIIPPLIGWKTTVDLSPTISLMVDQVKKLTSKGIHAILLGSAQTLDLNKQIESGEYQLVYTTPESFFRKS